ncbi:MAG TPA: DMT family transporter [Chloroflexia bacterium]|nr:DMT family transporter [Chloroflexia bacterium]
MRTPLAHRPRWQADLILGLVTLIWGGTFLLVQDSVRLTGPFSFLALRFLIGTLALGLTFPRRLARLTRRELGTGGVIGLFLFGGYALQTLALQLTTSAKVGFLTGLSVAMVPILAWGVLGQRPPVQAVVGTLLATMGLGLLSLGTGLAVQVGPGEALGLGCAVCFAAQIVAISRWAPEVDALNLAWVQVATTAGLSALAAPLHGEPLVLPPAPVWLAALFLGCLATAFAFAVINSVQQFTTSTRAALIYALEPVFAGLFGFWAGEPLTAVAWAGCGLIVLGMISGELHRPGTPVLAINETDQSR